MAYDFPTAPKYKDSAQNLSIAALAKRVPDWKYIPKNEYMTKHRDIIYVEADTTSSVEKDEATATTVYMEVTRVYITCGPLHQTRSEVQEKVQHFIAGLIEAGWTVWNGKESGSDSTWYHVSFLTAGGGYPDVVKQRLISTAEANARAERERNALNERIGNVKRVLQRHGLSESDANRSVNSWHVSLSHDQFLSLIASAESRNLPVGCWE